MVQRVAFLRAVNLGKRRVSMSRLVEALVDLGYDDVTTYVNSGNAAFTASGGRADLERAIGAELEKVFGFEVTTFVRTVAELKKVLDAEPFPVAAGDTYFVTFLKDVPTASRARELEGLSGEFDTLVVIGRDVHWRMHGKSSDSPLSKRDWERVLGKNSSTSRNTTMLRKLVTRLGQ
jgi:uncharacterized protein (DUF1697 family)